MTSYIYICFPQSLFFQTQNNDDDEDERIDEGKYFVVRLMEESALAKLLPFTSAGFHYGKPWHVTYNSATSSL